MDVQTVLTIVNVACAVIIAVVGFWVKRALDGYDHLEAEVIRLGRKVEVLLDRDRRKRIGDYESEDGWPKG